MSVLLGGGRLSFAPHAVRAGLVQLNVANQMPRAERLLLVGPDGRAVAAPVVIAAGGTAQLQARLTLPAYTLRALGRRWPALAVNRPARTADGAVQLP
ncbi:MAG: hypothetical protein KGL15_00075 [Acidobacteriota bacterium]|nr:hypothetical protein [Acidobacteriota bacterium]